MPDEMARQEPAPFREAVIDLPAITRNVAVLRERIGVEHVMAVVKANGYGHGAVESSRAALAGGADWLGVADVDEALQLRAAGIDAPILAWLHSPDVDFAPALAADVDIGISSVEQVRAVAAASADQLVATGPAGGSGSVPSERSSLGAGVAGSLSRSSKLQRATIQIKLETGLGRNGVSEPEWANVFETAAELQRAGAISVRGIFSHLSNTSPDDDRASLAAFERGIAAASAVGLDPELIHAASTSGALDLPESRYNMVRLGIGVYGLSPFDGRSSAELGLTPAMTLRGRIAAVRRVPAGSGVSYGYDYRTSAETTLALVPLGYAEGIPRQASNRAPVTINATTYTVSGRVAMDQFVVDVGQDAVSVGDEVVVFGDPATGVPSADEWAAAADTINYEIVTRLGSRLTRTYLNG